MKRLRKIKTPAPRWPVKSIEEVDDSIKRIGDLQRERERIEAEMNDQLATVKESYEQKAAQPTEELRARLDAVRRWCEPRRNTIAPSSKTGKFKTGEVSWRNRPPKVSIRGKEAVIQALQTAGLERFLRRKVEIDRTAILREWGGMEKATSTYQSAGRGLGGASSAPLRGGKISCAHARTFLSGRSCESPTLPAIKGVEVGSAGEESWCVPLGHLWEGGMSRVSTAFTSAGARLSAGRCDPVRAPPHSETAPAEELERDRERRRLSALDTQVA